MSPHSSRKMFAEKTRNYDLALRVGNPWPSERPPRYPGRSPADAGSIGAYIQTNVCATRGRCPQLKRDSLFPPCLSSLNTEHTEHLSDLCVEARLGTEDTEAMLTRGEISAARKEIWDL
jgi:hypothetical protein